MAQLAWNNPGNIGYGGFAAKYGAVASGTSDTGHFVAQFPTPQAGVQAMSDLALSKYNNGATTTNSLIAGQGGWTPGNYTAAANVAAYMGVSPNTDLQLNNPQNMANFQSALARQEGYGSSQSQNYFFGGNNAGGGVASGGGSSNLAQQDAAQDAAQDRTDNIPDGVSSINANQQNNDITSSQPMFTQPNYGADNTYDPATGTEFNSVGTNQFSTGTGASQYNTGLSGSGLPGTTGTDGPNALTSPQPSAPQQTPQQIGSSAGSSSSSSIASSGNNAGGGMPIDVTDVTSAGSIAGQAISSATTQAGSSISQGTQQAGQTVSSGVQQAGTAVSSSITGFGSTFQSVLNSLFQTETDLFVRAALVGLALVLLAGAFAFFTVERTSDGGVKFVPLPV